MLVDTFLFREEEETEAEPQVHNAQAFQNTRNIDNLRNQAKGPFTMYLHDLRTVKSHQIPMQVINLSHFHTIKENVLRMTKAENIFLKGHMMSWGKWKIPLPLCPLWKLCNIILDNRTPSWRNLTKLSYKVMKSEWL